MYSFDKTAVTISQLPMTCEKIIENMQAAELAWNLWASKNREANERYQHKFDGLSRILDPYTKQHALENLCLHEERRVFEAGARLWSEMIQWQDKAAEYQADKLIVDVSLNERAHWAKVLEGSDNPIHHAHEPVKSKVFLPIESKHSQAVEGFNVTDRRSSAT